MPKNNALAKIRTRAKQLRSKNKGLGWIAAIKQASKQLKATGAIGTKKKRDKNRQTGTSSKFHDQLMSARPPGSRKPSGGKKITYYERRKNRSDKPGSLTGIKMQIKQKLSKALLDYELATTVKATKAAQKRKVQYRKQLKALK